MGDESAEVLDRFQCLRTGLSDVTALVSYHAGGARDAQSRGEVRLQESGSRKRRTTGAVALWIFIGMNLARVA